MVEIGRPSGRFAVRREGERGVVGVRGEVREEEEGLRLGSREEDMVA